jgi:predicted transcriptional regulator
MRNPKEKVRRLLDTLPDDTSFEEIQYYIYVLQAIQRGLDAAERGELIEQDEFEKRITTRISRFG